MKMFLQGRWESRPQTIKVINPFDGTTIDEVPNATADDVPRACDTLIGGARTMRYMPAYRRYEILARTSQLILDHAEELAATISREEGKTLREAAQEVRRSAGTLLISAEEAKRLMSEVIPLDTAEGGEGKFGFTIRVPCGIVAAITPFNFPLNLVCHKVGPALAAGNAVLIKPASDTPLVALRLVELLLEAGLPGDAVACLTGSGQELGAAICAEPRVRKITFTGSDAVGRTICHQAGLKRVTMELGSNCALVILDDADIDKVVAATVATGYANAGQVCISTQRVVALDGIHDAFVERLDAAVGGIRAGNPFDEATRMGPMIRSADAQRVVDWLAEAKAGGARITRGGGRDGR